MHREDVLELAIVRLRPELTPIDGVDEIDCDAHALAYARLANAWRSLAALYLSEPKDIADAYERARIAAETALRLSPDLSEAHLALGYLKLTAVLDFAGAEPKFRRAAELAPSDYRPVDALAYLFAAQGRIDEAERAARRAAELDPLSVPPKFNLARIAMVSGRLDDAERNIRKAIALQPALSHAYAYLATIDLLRNDPVAARRDADLEPPGFWHDYADALARQRDGDRAAADAALKAMSEKYSYGGPFQVAIIHALRKEPDLVFEWLEKALQSRDAGLTQLFVTPFLIDYRNDPRFVAIAKKLGVDSTRAGRD